MARPKKNTVDYFPHKCVSGKTIFILEQEFGNDGYAFWFKLLEQLGSKEGHFIDCNTAAELRFLQAKTRLSGEMTLKILDLLAELEAIDPELWAQKVIWSQNFVDGVAGVYLNRRVEKPTKPSFYSPKPTEVALSSPDNSQSTEESAQRRVEYSRVEESKEEKNTPPKKSAGEEKSDESPNSGSVPTESEKKSIPQPPSFSDPRAVYNAEECVKANPVQLQQLMMDLQLTDQGKVNDVLRKYHLHLLENNKYPMGRVPIFAGFEKWLRNEKTFTQKNYAYGNKTRTTTGPKPLLEPQPKGAFKQL
jgi:hypothetical protein